MEAGAIPNRLQDPPDAIACSQPSRRAFFMRVASAGKEFKSTRGALVNRAFRITVTVRVISASAVS
jgi:hypothetical protein